MLIEDKFCNKFSEKYCCIINQAGRLAVLARASVRWFDSTCIRALEFEICRVAVATLVPLLSRCSLYHSLSRSSAQYLVYSSSVCAKQELKMCVIIIY